MAGFVIYWGFAILTGWEVSLAGIPAGLAVGQAMHYASEKRGGRMYQVLAVTLAFAAFALTYIPGMASIAFKGGVTVPALLFVIFMTVISPFTDPNNGFIGQFMVFAGLCLAWTLTGAHQPPAAARTPRA